MSDQEHDGLDPGRWVNIEPPPPSPELPNIIVTDGPCPPGYVRVHLDAVDGAGRFTAGLSFCERRDPA